MIYKEVLQVSESASHRYAVSETEGAHHGLINYVDTKAK
jgi:hypothetical protein